MVRRTTECIIDAGIEEIVVVTGALCAPVATALAGLPVLVVVNDGWRLGLSTSVQTGIRSLSASTIASLLVLADQPYLRPDTIQALTCQYHKTRSAIVAPRYKGRRGNPVIFDHSLFKELAKIKGDRGGRVLIRRHRHALETVEVHDPGILADVDTPEDVRGTQSETELRSQT
jgi:molybdenum cofactor cytidylyltransferase